MKAPMFKKLVASFLFSLCLIANINSQTVQDFTVTDTNGKVHSLYSDYLDQDRIVVIKLYWAGCPPCNSTAKEVQALYQKWEEGAGKVEFLALATQSFEGNAQTISYIDRHDITFPMASPDGNSLAAIEQFDFSGTPTYIIVAPDRSFIFDPNGLDELDAAISSLVNAEVPDCPTTDITINSAADLEDYRSLYPNCTDFAGNITVNGDVSNLLGLDAIKTVTGNIDIESDALINLSDLSNLENITGTLRISGSENLNSLIGLGKLNNVTGSIVLSNLIKLASLDGIKNIQSIGGLLTIDNCGSLQSLEGLGNLQSINSSLTISNNVNLRSLDGIESLNRVNSKLAINGNESLTSIEGITNINLFSSLDIVGNTFLSDCAINSICNLIEGDLSIPTNISDNATGCESLSAVNAACSPAELPTSFSVSILDAFDKPVEGVLLSAKSNTGETTDNIIGTSDPDGLVTFQLPNENITSFEGLILEYEEPSNATISGISVIDLVRIQNHILGLQPLTNPYAIIAADANGNGSVSATDLVFMINVIIGKRSTFGDDKVYQIINEHCSDSDIDCDNTPLIKNSGNLNQIKLRAIRIGDING